MDPATRIVSLVPSLTELIADFGLADRLVGRTRFCTEPAALAASVPAVGGTKDPKVDRVIALAPDLVIANREENRREDVEALRAAGLRVLVTCPDTVDEAIAMVSELGSLLGCEVQATALVTATREALGAPGPAHAPRVFVPIWYQPLLGLGSQSYGHDLLVRCGAVNVLEGQPRYPETTLAEVALLRPDLVLLPDEPFPFDASHIPAFVALAPVRLVDGKSLWWYGPRMPASIRALKELLRSAG